MMSLQILQIIIGIVIFLGMAFGLSHHRNRIIWSSVVKLLLINIMLIGILLYVPIIKELIQWLGNGMNVIKNATATGTEFVFGYLAGGTTPFIISNPYKIFIFAFQALPLIIVISALSMLLFHWRIIPFIIRIFSFGLRGVLPIDGPMSLFLAAKLFLGQTEAPFLIKPYLAGLSQHKLFLIMTAGMSTTSAAIWMVYSSILNDVVPNVIEHILSAAVTGVFMSLLFVHIIMPPLKKNVFSSSEEAAEEIFSKENLTTVMSKNKNFKKSTENTYIFINSMDAITQGTLLGVNMAVSIGAVILVTVAFVTLFNSFLTYIPSEIPMTLERIFGYCMAPFAWCMGIPKSEILVAGGILGTKTIINELAAMITLSSQSQLSEFSRIVLTYGLCAFGNISSISIQIAGLGHLIPERKDDVIELARDALLASTLVSCTTGAIVGFWINVKEMINNIY